MALTVIDYSDIINQTIKDVEEGIELINEAKNNPNKEIAIEWNDSR